MKTIGLIGGMSWESTALYYQTINRTVAQRLGGLHSAKIQLISLDFQDIATRQKADDWSGMTDILCDAAAKLERGGADCVLICTNTMHKVAPQVQAAIKVPVLHIVDALAEALLSKGLNTVGLTGTRFTMEQPFYSERLIGHGITCLTPDQAQRDEIHRIIFEELCRGVIKDDSRAKLVACIDSLKAKGAQAAVLGCTELILSVGAKDSALPVFDTTQLHAMAAVQFALS